MRRWRSWNIKFGIHIGNTLARRKSIGTLSSICGLLALSARDLQHRRHTLSESLQVSRAGFFAAGSALSTTQVSLDSGLSQGSAQYSSRSSLPSSLSLRSVHHSSRHALCNSRLSVHEALLSSRDPLQAYRLSRCRSSISSSQPVTLSLLPLPVQGFSPVWGDLSTSCKLLLLFTQYYYTGTKVIWPNKLIGYCIIFLLFIFILLSQNVRRRSRRRNQK